MFPQDVIRLGILFDDRGHKIRAVGGWVRDKIRGLPSQDLDLATTALPDEVIALCNAHGFKYLNAGLQHGTVPIVYRDVVYEITTLRVDTQTDGRHAVVEFTDDWRVDAARRDFTINAMSMDMSSRLYDYFDGARDLQARRVVFVGDAAARIKEDYLRILRYYRFKGWIGDMLDETYAERCIRDNADGLRSISVERIWKEMQRILIGNNLRNVLLSMWVTGTTHEIGLDDITTHDIDRACKVRELTKNPLTVLAALTKRPMAETWKMSKDESSLLRWLQVDRDLGAPTMRDLKDIATTKGLGHAYAVERAAMYHEMLLTDHIRHWEVPAFPVTGADMIERGYRTGTDLGSALAALRLEWQQSDYVMSREELLSKVKLIEH